MTESLLIGIFANFSTAIIIGILIYVLHVRSTRDKLLRFFGITIAHDKVSIYLSKVQAIAEQPSDRQVSSTEGFRGDLISKIEYDSANVISRLFESKTLILIPKFLVNCLLSEIFSLLM